MRDNHDGMIEFIDAIEVDEKYFVRIALPLGGIKHYQFGVQKTGYNTIKRIFQYRPFDKLSVNQYRYFWDLSHGTDENGYFIGVRFEQESNYKSFPIKGCEKLASNLVWFSRIESPEEIKHLAIEI